jgi:hypothetical protein
LITAIDLATGTSAVSRTHAANRAFYDWSAKHFAAMIPDPYFAEAVRTVTRLRDQTPLDRVGWTAEQWCSHEHAGNDQWRGSLQASRSPPVVRGARHDWFAQ